jgi:hypothetical protein
MACAAQHPAGLTAAVIFSVCPTNARCNAAAMFRFISYDSIYA